MENIMVCVTKQKTCQRLIDYGKKLACSEGDELFVIHVAGEKENLLGHKEEGEALEFLYEKAKEAGASLTVEKSSDVMQSLVNLVDKHDITKVVAGESGEKDKSQGFLAQLEQQLAGKATLLIVPAVS